MPLYCDDPIPQHQEDCCQNSPGRIIAVAYIRSDATITDYTDISEWNVDITAGRIHVIKCVRGSKPPSESIEGEGFGREQSISISRNFTVNYSYSNVNDNIDFHNALNYSSGHRLAYYTQEGTVYVVTDNSVNHNADYEIEEGLDTMLKWVVIDTWTDTQIPLGFVAPPAVFE